MTHGCHNATRKPDYYVHVRQYRPDGTYVMKMQRIEDHSTRECQYDKRNEDKACEGCAK